MKTTIIFNFHPLILQEGPAPAQERKCLVNGER
jgi:hypothetical protein